MMNIGSLSTGFSCDVCEAPATQWTLDFRQTNPPDATYKAYRPYGKMHFGCAKHVPESRIYNHDDIDYPVIFTR